MLSVLPPTHPDAEASTNTALPSVLEEAYASTVDPERYENLLDAWEQYLVSLKDAGDTRPDASAVYAVHFSRALEILDRLGRAQQTIDAEQVTVDAISWPAFLCDGHCKVSASNRPVDVALPCALDNYHQDAQMVEQVRAAIDTWSSKQGQTRLLPLLTADGKLRNCVIITELESQSSRPQVRDRRFLVALANVEFDASVQAMLCDEFGLTGAELRTLERLVQGFSAEQISELRHVTINTTRKQIRGLLDKTGAGSQTDLIRLAVALVSQVSESRFAIDASNMRVRDSRDWRRITLQDGRQLNFLDFGDPQGRPILFLHHMMGGPMWTPRSQAEASENNWRVIAPSRPGFGRSDPLALKGEALVNQTIGDLCALLDTLSIEAAVLLGSTSAAGLAACFVVQQPQRSLAMLNVGFGGRCDDTLIASFPKRLRIMAQTSRTSELATRFLARVGVAAIDILGSRRHLEVHVEQSPPDMQVIADKVICATLSDGLTHSVHQGVEAFCKDGYLALADWGDALAQASILVPSACVVGMQDRTTPFDQMQRLLGPLTDYQVIAVEDAGQLVFYSHWPVVMQQLESLWLRRIGSE